MSPEIKYYTLIYAAEMSVIELFDIIFYKHIKLCSADVTDLDFASV